MKVDKWGYEVNTSSDTCISTINAFYDQVCGTLFLGHFINFSKLWYVKI